jgi:hypothetical protein
MRKTLFILGIILFIISLPLSFPLIMEKVYNYEMSKKYKITEINEMHKGAPTAYRFENSYINIYRLSKNHELQRDHWDNLIDISDVDIAINGETEEILEEYPVRIGEEGLNQYKHYLSYWLVEEKQTDKKSFVIVLQMNGAKEDLLINGKMGEFVPKEKLEYSTITIQEDGTISRDNFTYENKNKLQTKLIPPMYFGGAGYYTDVWFAYPNILYPFIYPFFTMILGLIFILIGFPYKHLTNNRNN